MSALRSKIQPFLPMFFTIKSAKEVQKFKMVHCVMDNCTSGDTGVTSHQTFAVPMEKQLRNRWKIGLKLPTNFKFPDDSRVCERHFKEVSTVFSNIYEVA